MSASFTHPCPYCDGTAVYQIAKDAHVCAKCGKASTSRESMQKYFPQHFQRSEAKK